MNNDILILIAILLPIVIILLLYRSDVKFYRELYHKEADTSNSLALKIMDMHSHHSDYIIEELNKLKKSKQSAGQETP